ncbi:hypothetical protein F5X68DRAFT_254799 [Plectosphaerella plurivora]|uniref:Xylanolytic transcriptional activator regulatory domain-containing protein n=1 Tax=Plectosphaerella plurivora TaxID=936078 RepID=A0A9P8VCJ8_9PEZI|nr:hypothetical protein F5X68DRAFT_254799 [Plectosphaerella plurivora]
MSKMQFTGAAAHMYRKTFWLLYSMEKVMAFHFGRSSSFVDGDIACPIPDVPEATSAGFNWFLPQIRFSRLLSRAYTSLYSVGVSSNPSSYYLGVVEQLRAELEQWRISLPDTGFRPGGSIRPQAMLQRQSRSLALMFHYFYHSLMLTLCRTTLWAAPGSGDAEALARAERRKHQALFSARAVLELTAVIDVEPYTQVCVLAGIPITALFVLFDMVIQDGGVRTHETQTNLALLDMAAGHFSRIEYASGGTLPGSLIAEFAHVARDYINGKPRDGLPIETETRADPADDPLTTLPPEQAVSLASVDQATTTANWSFMPQPEAMPTLDNGLQMTGEYGVGTDVMDLFNYFVPDLDPMFYDGAGAWKDSSTSTWG